MKIKNKKRYKISKEKNEYSKIDYENFRYIRKMSKKKNLNWEEIYSKGALYQNSSEEIEFFIMEMSLIRILLKNKYTNYFVESNELSNFLRNTLIKKNTIDSISDIIKNNENFIDNNALIGNLKKLSITKEKLQNFTGCCFSKNFKRSIFFNFTLVEGEHPYLFISNGDDLSKLPLFGTENTRTNISKLDFNGEMIRFVINLVCYMSTFPEKIIIGAPFVTTDNINNTNSKTISVSNQISDYLYETRDVSPHLRRGHFKYLESKYYKKMRYKTIFVNPSFVKGKAKTIIENEDYKP